MPWTKPGGGGSGTPGKSAYEVWLDQGNTGTVDDFFASIGGGGGSSWITGKKINCLGDSITEGTTGGATSWTNLLASTYGCTVRNYGMSGTTLAVNNPNSLYARYPNMDNDADAVIVWGGWNDINQGVSLGTFTDSVDTTFYGALQLMADGLLTKYTGKRVIYGTLLAATHNWNTVKTYNAAIREVAEYWGIPVIEFSSLGFNSRNADSKSAYFNTDGIHPNTAGNTMIANFIARYMNFH